MVKKFVRNSEEYPADEFRRANSRTNAKSAATSEIATVLSRLEERGRAEGAG